MSNYEEVVKKIRKQIQFPENQLRGITESTGLRILDALYILIAMLHQRETNGADEVNLDLDK